MAGPTPSWNTVPLFGTWRNYDGTLKAGAYKVTSAVRVTNTTDDVIVPAGLVASGALNEKEATGGGKTHSLYLDVPASDDPDNDVRGWQLTVEVTFKDSPGEKYVIDTPLSAMGNTPPGINLRKVVLPQTIPVPASVFIKGVPGGLAVYDKDGDVVDAAGNKVTGGTGTGGTSGPVYSGSITDASDVGKALLTASSTAVARAALGAGTSNLQLGTTAGTAKSGDYAPTKSDLGLSNVDNTSDAAKPISSATQTALNGKAAANHTHTSAGITDFNSAAQSAALQPIVQNTDGSWPARTTVTTNRNVRVTWVGTLPGPVVGPGAAQAVSGRDVMDVTTVIPQ